MSENAGKTSPLFAVTAVLSVVCIREAQSYPTKKKLLQSLPRQVQYQTFNRILDYLESSNKIVYDK